MNQKPSVTIMIATKDRHEDLELTLRDLLRQDYPNLEMMVIDDGSTPPIESLVKQYWPNACVVRHNASCGQCERRNEGFHQSSGDYILHLDDDCSPRAANAISLMVALMEKNPHWFSIAPYIWNGARFPSVLDTLTPPAGMTASFLGAATLLRSSVVHLLEGYRSFYVSYAEEEELCLQALNKGYGTSFRPELLFHHRYSPRNRNNGAAWKRALRNRMWTILIHMPLSRIPMEIGWKLGFGAWDAFRLRRLKLYFEALWEFTAGLRMVLRLRQPLNRVALRRYDAMRSYGLLPYDLFEQPPADRLKTFKRWAARWPKRLRDGSFFSKKRNLGQGEFATHEHELHLGNR